MTITGTIYGVILNDREEYPALAASFAEKPYAAPPVAPVVYIKPRQCVTTRGGAVSLPAEVSLLEAAPTLGLLFVRDVAQAAADDVWDAVGAVCLALDMSIPQENYYRPAVAQRGRDGFLPLGDFVAPRMARDIVTRIDGLETHRWSPQARLARPIGKLVADLSAFMTLRAGDLLLVGLPGDAPQVRDGQNIEVQAEGFPVLRTSIAGGLA